MLTSIKTTHSKTIGIIGFVNCLHFLTTSNYADDMTVRCNKEEHESVHDFMNDQNFTQLAFIHTYSQQQTKALGKKKHLWITSFLT